MPVWLDAVPEEAASIKRPDTRRWLIILVVVLFSGVSLTLLLWQGERAGPVFWLTAIALPVLTWGLLFSLRRVAYKAEQVGAQSWNEERQALIASETQRGQRPAWILDIRAETRAGNNLPAITDAIKSGFPVLERFIPPGKLAPVQYAALAQRDTADKGILQHLIARHIRHITDTLKPLRTDLNCWLLIDSNCPVSDETERQISLQLTVSSGRSFRRIGQFGPAGFDTWLDLTGPAPAVLVVISLQLPAVPAAGGADAIVTAVFANRPSAHYPDAVCLHRPESGSADEAGLTLKRALLWASVPAGKLNRAWISGEALMEGAAWGNACDSNGVTFSLTDDLRAPDAIIGYSGIASPWLMAALAQASTAPGEAQAIACQNTPQGDNIWVMVVRNTQEIRSTGNV